MTPSSRRLAQAIAVALSFASLAGCGAIDDVLEAEVITGHLFVSTQSGQVSIAQGSEHAQTITVKRPEGISPSLHLTLDAPTGITGTFDNIVTDGLTTTATLTIHVEPSVSVGTHQARVMGKGTKVNGGSANILVTVVQPPSFTLQLTTSILQIARGGIAPLGANLSRTNFTAPVALSLTSDTPGITATSAAVSGDAATVTVQVSADVPAGTYPVMIRGDADGVSPRSASLSVVVIAEPVQLIALNDLAAAQGASAMAELIINRAGYTGALELVADAPPAGVTVAFAPGAETATSTTLTASVGPSASAGTHAVTIRARGTGVPDAVVSLELVVQPTTLAIGLSPSSLSLFAGTTTTSTLSIARTGAEIPVDVSILGAPAGLSVSIVGSPASATSVGIAVTATSSIAPGQYPVVVRVAISGFPESFAQTAELTVSVRESSGTGNVIVDFSRCETPLWLGYQDGTQPWTQALASKGVYRFTINSARGGVAFATASSVFVEYMTLAELTNAPHDRCPLVEGTKTVSASPLHTENGEAWQYAIGGGAALSLTGHRSVDILGVKPGTHDFVVWGSYLQPNGAATFGRGRGYLRRDVNPAEGEHLGEIDMYGALGHGGLQARLTIGGFVTGETAVAHSMGYLTTAGCTLNPMYTVSGNQGIMLGFPPTAQRPTDFHMLSVQTGGPGWTRSLQTSFHTMAQRTVSFGPLPNLPQVQSIPYSYKALSVSLIGIPTSYDGAVTLEYVSGTKSMRVKGSIAYFNAFSFVLAMPDLSAAAGWPAASALPPTATGTWTIVWESQTSPTSRCVEGHTYVRTTRSGNY